MSALIRPIMTIGAFIAIGSLWALLYVQPGTGEFVIAVMSVLLGAVMVALAIVLARGDLRRVVDKEDRQ
jgi:hypothetical protein